MGGDEKKNTSAATGSPASSGHPKITEFSKKTPLEWAKELKVKAYYLPGVVKFAGWKDDQLLTKAEFERKLSEWLHRPIGGRRAR